MQNRFESPRPTPNIGRSRFVGAASLETDKLSDGTIVTLAQIGQELRSAWLIHPDGSRTTDIPVQEAQSVLRMLRRNREAQLPQEGKAE